MMNRKTISRVKVISNTTAVATVIFYLGLINSAWASSDADYSFVINSDWHDCQKIDPSYQEVYAFETASFYVNICQRGNTYFYSAEAKHSENNSTFITAHPLENAKGFQAKNGNVSYLVLLPFAQRHSLKSETSQPTEAVLTIKRNNRLVSVESSLNKYCHRSETATAWDTIELQPRNSNHLATVPQQQDVGPKFPANYYQGDRLLPTEIFNSESRFDFYRIGGKLHRLTTCN